MKKVLAALLTLALLLAMPFDGLAAGGKLKMNKSSVTMKVGGKTVQLTVKTKLDAGTPVEWSSSDTSVVTVDDTGRLTPVSAGSARVTAQTQDGRKGVVQVKVKFIKVKKISVGVSLVSTRVGNTYAAKATLKPSDASDQRVEWISSDESVARVDANGVVTGVGVGTCKITARSVATPSVSAGFTVKVRAAAQEGKRLSGIIVGVNAGHQRYGDYRTDPIYPGARRRRYKVGVGTTGHWSRKTEYQVNLEVALKLRPMLEAEGATVVMIRETNNVNISNVKRARIMNEAGCDVALNLHCNGSHNRSAHGLRLYTPSVGAVRTESYQIARTIAPIYCRITGARNGGVTRSRGYISLNYSEIPVILVEMGYMSNKAEDLLLGSSAYQMKIAEGLTEGLCEYFN